MKKTLRLQNERGFLALSLAVLPLALVLIFGAFHLNTLIFQEREIQNVCRDRLLAAQKRQARRMEELLRLNPAVARLNLEHQRKKAQLEGAAAAKSPLVALYGAQLAKIIARQISLARKQASIITTGRARLTVDLRRLKPELETLVRKRSGRTATGSFDARFQIPAAPSWALEPQGSPFPEYRVPGDFPERQALQVAWNWNFNPTEGVEQWIPWKTKKALRCGATLRRHAGTFESRIHEDRSFSKFW